MNYYNRFPKSKNQKVSENDVLEHKIEMKWYVL